MRGGPRRRRLSFAVVGNIRAWGHSKKRGGGCREYGGVELGEEEVKGFSRLNLQVVRGCRTWLKFLTGGKRKSFRPARTLEIKGRGECVDQSRAQHFLYFFPLPQGQGSLRPSL